MDLRSLFVDSLGLSGGADLAAPLPTAHQRAGSMVVNFGPVGRCPRHLDVRHIAITDLSGSLGGNGAAGNDPAGLRHAALLRASEKVAMACKCGRESIQVFSFDLTSQLDVGPVLLNRSGFEPLRRALSDRNVGWGISTLGPSLRAAREGVDDFDGKVTLTVMSDFLLTDVPTVIDELAEFPADAVHAIVLTAPAPRAFDQHPDVTVTTAGWSDKPAVVAEAIYGELTRFRTHADVRRVKPRSRS